VVVVVVVAAVPAAAAVALDRHPAVTACGEENILRVTITSSAYCYPGR
jgi:hypothetical protein